MTATVSRSPELGEDGGTAVPAILRWAVASVDGFVVAFAWFTVLAHLWDILNADVTPLLITWAVTVPVPLWVVSRFSIRSPDAGDLRPDWLRSRAKWRRPSRYGLVGFALLIVFGASLLASSEKNAWRLGWGLGLIAVAIAVAVLIFAGRPAADETGPEPTGAAPPSATGHSYRAAFAGLWVAVVAGIGFAMVGLFTVTPDGDSAYYVNRVTWIANHGTIPDRDTMFSNNVLKPLYTPAIGTWETFAGAIAHAFGIAGPTVEFLILGPLVLGLVPLLLWRALIPFRLRRPVIGLIAVIALMLFSFRGQQWFGEVVLRRAWETKFIFAAVMVPLVYAYGATAARRGGWRPAALLVAGTIASIGMSSSAAGLLPIVLVIVALAGYLMHGPRIVLPVVLALGYPIICLVAYRFSGSAKAFETAKNPRFVVPYSVWHFFVGSGLLGAVVAVAMLGGFLGVREPVARLALAIGSLGVMLAFAPKFLKHAGPLLGGAPTAWRVLWIAPVLVLVAGGVSALDGLGARIGAATARYLAPAAAALLVVLLALFETPITSAPSADVKFVSSPRWDIKPSALDAARRLVSMVPPGSTVAAPDTVSVAVAITSDEAFALDARKYYGMLVAKDNGPAFRWAARRDLSLWLTHYVGAFTDNEAAQALARWPVRALCLQRDQPRPAYRAKSAALTSAGYLEVGHDAYCGLFQLSA